MESEDFDLIHSRYDYFVRYLRETQQSEIAAYENWIKKETLVLAKKRERNEQTNEKPLKVDCIFCYKEVAKQNISFHYDSCLGAQFFNYMRGGIYKGRHTCKECGKIILKKHRNRHRCDINKKNAYITCELCGFNFIYHKKCRVKDLVEAYYKKIKDLNNEIISDNLNLIEKKINRKAEMNSDQYKIKNNENNIEIHEKEKNNYIISMMNSQQVNDQFISNQNLINSPELRKNIEFTTLQNNLSQKISEDSSNYHNMNNEIIKGITNIIMQSDYKEKVVSQDKNQNQIENKFTINVTNSQEFQKEQLNFKSVDSQEDQEKPLSFLTKLEFLKIAKMEMKIMMKFKNWFDKMRTHAIMTNNIQSYRKEMKYIHKIISKLPDKMKYEYENVIIPHYFREIEIKNISKSNLEYNVKDEKLNIITENKTNNKENDENNFVFDLPEITESKQKEDWFLKLKRKSSDNKFPQDGILDFIISIDDINKEINTDI